MQGNILRDISYKNFMRYKSYNMYMFIIQTLEYFIAHYHWLVLHIQSLKNFRRAINYCGVKIYANEFECWKLNVQANKEHKTTGKVILETNKHIWRFTASMSSFLCILRSQKWWTYIWQRCKIFVGIVWLNSKK